MALAPEDGGVLFADDVDDDGEEAIILNSHLSLDTTIKLSTDATPPPPPLSGRHHHAITTTTTHTSSSLLPITAAPTKTTTNTIRNTTTTNPTLISHLPSGRNYFSEL